MIPYILSAALITHLAPNVWSWSWWGTTTVVRGGYWLLYGRFEAARQEERLRKIFRDEIENYEIAIGGTDVILVPVKK
jgi:protein-S-isoprenylcysteine O-methyltransferase Ste14